MKANCAIDLPSVFARRLGHLPELLEEEAAPSLGEVLVYDSFNNLTNEADLPPGFRFQSLELDDSAPLYAAQARCYDLRPGRWMEDAPVCSAAGDANLYRYVSDQRGILINKDGTIRDA